MNNQRFFNGADRRYDASDFTDVLAAIVSNGVCANVDSNALSVSVKRTTNEIIVEKGSAFVNGYHYRQVEQKKFTIPALTATKLESVIVVRLDLNERTIDVIQKNNQQGHLPVREGNVYEIVLGYVSLFKGQSSVIPVDTRGNGELCGYAGIRL